VQGSKIEWKKQEKVLLQFIIQTNHGTGVRECRKIIWISRFGEEFKQQS